MQNKNYDEFDTKEESKENGIEPPKDEIKQNVEQ